MNRAEVSTLLKDCVNAVLYKLSLQIYIQIVKERITISLKLLGSLYAMSLKRFWVKLYTIRWGADCRKKKGYTQTGPDRFVRKGPIHNAGYARLWF